MKKFTAILLTISILLSSLTLTTYADETNGMYRTTSSNFSVESDKPNPTDNRN